MSNRIRRKRNEYKTRRRVCEESLPFRVLKGGWWEWGEYREFALLVPPSLDTVYDAVPWTFEESPEQYWKGLQVET